MQLKKLAFSALVLALTSFAFAAPGELDPTFNGTGMLPAGAGVSGYNPVNLLLVQPDGKILMARGGSSIQVARFNPSGAPDLSFGVNGISYSNTPTYWWTDLRQIVLQSDGKILIGGSTAQSACSVERLNADGSIDTSFGVNGLAARSISGATCWGTSVAVDANNKIVLGGYVVSGTDPNQPLSDWIAIRLHPDGSADTSFGTGGTASIRPYQSSGTFNSTIKILAQPDGKIIIAGQALDSNGTYGYVRFNANGTPDSSFGVDGISRLQPRLMLVSNVALQPDGKIVAVGAGLGPHPFTIARTNGDGTMDTSFGTEGFTDPTWTTSYSYTSTAIALQPDGKILAGGAAQIGGISTLGVVRYNTDGTLDRAPAFAPFAKRESVLTAFWGNDGIATAPLGIDMRMCNLAIDPAGRAIIFGQPVFGSSGGSLTLARFQSDAPPYANISGTVRTAGGLPIRNAYVTISGGELAAPITVFTNNLGIYFFSHLPVTENYTITATAKRFRFANGERSVMLNADTENFDFAANQ